VTRQPDFSSEPRAVRVPGWHNLALAGGALVALAAVLAAFRTTEEAATAEQRLAEVRRDVAAAADRVEALEARARAVEAGMLAPDDAPPARIVADVAEALPGDVRLERLAIDYRHGGVLELSVVARDASAWDRLLQQLELAPRLRAVTPGPEARAAEVRSLVRARWGSEPR
jgi:Tfp pilus assembly protein PilN